MSDFSTSGLHGVPENIYRVNPMDRDSGRNAGQDFGQTLDEKKKNKEDALNQEPEKTEKKDPKIIEDNVILAGTVIDLTKKTADKKKPDEVTPVPDSFLSDQQTLPGSHIDILA